MDHPNQGQEVRLSCCKEGETNPSTGPADLKLKKKIDKYTIEIKQ